MERTLRPVSVIPLFVVLLAGLLLATPIVGPLLQARPVAQPALSLSVADSPALPAPLPPLSEHALLKHGNDAPIAWNWINANGKFCRLDDCPDSNIHYGCKMPDGRYAVAVVIEEVSTVTAFIVGDRDAAARFNSGCNNPWFSVHP